MVFIYGRANGNANAAMRLFRTQYPNRRCPSNGSVFRRAYQRLRDTGTIFRQLTDVGRNVFDSHFEESILQVFAVPSETEVEMHQRIQQAFDKLKAESTTIFPNVHTAIIYRASVCVEVSDQSTKLHQRMESIMCHICNTHVPKQFLKEHTNSLKHKIYMEIANTALKRIKDQIYNENNYDKIEINESIYFCPHCVSVVNVNEMKNHENSTNHKNSVFLDERLSDFLNLYSNNIEKADNAADTVYEEFNKSLASTESSKQIQLQDTITNLDLTSYLNLLRDKYKMTTNIRLINEGWFEVEVEGSLFKVSASNFLALKEKSDQSSSIYCVVCLKNFNYEDIESHLMESKHLYRISTAMLDIHFKREIYPFWHNCVLCNITIANYDFHKMSDEGHQKLLEEALISDAEGNWTVSSNDVTLVSNNNSNETDVTMTEHVNDVKSKYDYMFKIERGRLWCIVCDVGVNEADCFETHIHLDDHIKKYKELLATNKLQTQYNNALFCGVCNEVVLPNNEFLHVIDVHHKKHLQDFKKNNQIKMNSYYCDDCDVHVPNNDYNIKSHNQGRLHLKKISKFSTKRRYFDKKRN